MNKAIAAAKLVLVLSTVGLLVISYGLRSRLLAMIWQSVSAQDIVATDQMRQYRESATDRETEYKARLAAFDAEMKVYLARIDLFVTDRDAYRRETQDGRALQAPMLPVKPRPPRSPAVQDQLAQANEVFRTEREAYFRIAPAMNILAACFAIGVVGSLLFLICFDPRNGRIGYILVLVLSFVFLIGPALYSLITASVYRMPPPVYEDPYAGAYPYRPGY